MLTTSATSELPANEGGKIVNSREGKAMSGCRSPGADSLRIRESSGWICAFEKHMYKKKEATNDMELRSPARERDTSRDPPAPSMLGHLKQKEGESEGKYK